MPLFEFLCKKCGHEFEALVIGSLAPSCPKCRSLELEQILSTFATRGGHKSASSDVSGGTGVTGGG